jgi:hypothetical protein
MLKPDSTGRLMLDFECVYEGDPDSCSWTTVDSPMLSQLLYYVFIIYVIIPHPDFYLQPSSIEENT